MHFKLLGDIILAEKAVVLKNRKKPHMWYKFLVSSQRKITKKADSFLINVY